MYCQKHLEIYLTTNKKALGFYFPVNKMGEHEDLNISSATSCLTVSCLTIQFLPKCFGMFQLIQMWNFIVKRKMKSIFNFTLTQNLI